MQEISTSRGLVKRCLTSEVRLSGRDLFASQIPARPYCADYYDEGVHPRNREHALRRRHVQFNQPHSVDWLIFDIDRDEAYRAAEDANLPQPNVLAINPSNGHGHAAYLLATPVLRFETSNRAPINYLADIQRGFTRRLGADKAFHGIIAKNPLHTDWRTCWLASKAYTLEDLDCELSKTDKAKEKQVEQVCGEGRNCTIFEDLRQLAYREALKYFGNPVGFNARMLELAQAMNQQFAYPLRPTEVRSIAKSISKWIGRKFSAEQFGAIQSARANRRWHGHVAASATQPWWH